MRVADDKSQLPMFDDEELRKSVRDLLEVARLQALAIEHLTAQRNGTIGSLPSTPTEPEKRPHQPQNKELRDWLGFRGYFQHLEEDVRDKSHLAPDDRVTKAMIYAAGGPPVKTITRIMTERYGLLHDQWPPSTWPAEGPGDKN